MTRAAIVGLAGRPNAGKSTLVNAVCGARVAIVSDRPQTTRRAVRGIATDPEAGHQLILTDLPGVQRPRDGLTGRMQRRVQQELADADIVLLLLNGEEGVGPGDRFIAGELLDAADAPVIAALNKRDRLSPAQTTAALAATAELPGVDEIFPISARTGEGVNELVGRLAELAPEGPFLYPAQQRTDLAQEVAIAELIREQALKRTREEIPHAIEVAVEEFAERDDGLVEIAAQLWVETGSQKKILVGKGGSMVKAIGTAARKEIEAELGVRTFLELEIAVRAGWRRDDGLLDRLGID